MQCLLFFPLLFATIISAAAFEPIKFNLANKAPKRALKILHKRLTHLKVLERLHPSFVKRQALQIGARLAPGLDPLIRSHLWNVASSNAPKTPEKQLLYKKTASERFQPAQVPEAVMKAHPNIARVYKKGDRYLAYAHEGGDAKNLETAKYVFQELPDGTIAPTKLKKDVSFANPIFKSNVVEQYVDGFVPKDAKDMIDGYKYDVKAREVYVNTNGINGKADFQPSHTEIKVPISFDVKPNILINWITNSFKENNGKKPVEVKIKARIGENPPGVDSQNLPLFSALLEPTRIKIPELGINYKPHNHKKESMGIYVDSSQPFLNIPKDAKFTSKLIESAASNGKVRKTRVLYPDTPEINAQIQKSLENLGFKNIRAHENPVPKTVTKGNLNLPLIGVLGGAIAGSVGAIISVESDGNPKNDFFSAGGQ